jgi:hypothetical protein
VSRFEQAVQVGASKYVHVVSAFNDQFTRCGLRQDAGTLFQKTTEEVTCKFCQRPAKRPA